MTSRPGLYILCGLGLLFSWFIGDAVHENTKMLEKLVQKQPRLQTANVIGKESPEKFYVINGDTSYVEIDGKSVRDYFGRRK